MNPYAWLTLHTICLESPNDSCCRCSLVVGGNARRLPLWSLFDPDKNNNHDNYRKSGSCRQLCEPHASTV